MPAARRTEGVRKTLPCNGCGVSFELDLPANLDLELHSSNGTLAVTGTGRSLLALDTSNGPITITRAEGTLDARTSNGPISLNDVRLSGASRNVLRTSNGPVTLVGVEGEDGLVVEATTSNGHTAVLAPGYQVTLDRNYFRALKNGTANATLEVRTSNGAITMR